MWMKSEVFQEKINTRDELVARIMNNAALLKQEHQDDFRRVTCNIATSDKKCIEFDGGIFKHIF
jgi:hypothetical protein